MITTKQNKEAFLIAYKANKCNIRKASDEIGVNRRTIFVWLKKDEKFKQAIDDIDEGLLDDIEEHLYDQSESGIANSTIFYLKSSPKAKKRGWAENLGLNDNISEIKITIKKKEDIEE